MVIEYKHNPTAEGDDKMTDDPLLGGLSVAYSQDSL